MSWSDLWTFYRGCDSAEIRKQILKQINLKEFLPNQAHRVQFEILEHAPMDIVQGFSSLLTPQAKKKLGISASLLTYELEKKLRKMFK